MRIGEYHDDDDRDGPNEVLSKDEIAALLALSGEKESEDAEDEKDDSSSSRGLKSIDWFKYLPRCYDDEPEENADIDVDVYANDKKFARGKLVYQPCAVNVKITEFVGRK